MLPTYAASARNWHGLAHKLAVPSHNVMRSAYTAAITPRVCTSVLFIILGAQACAWARALVGGAGAALTKCTMIYIIAASVYRPA